VKSPGTPRFEERRKEEFAAELRKRAQAWIPSWDLSGGERDFGHALLEIATRFNSEVAERLDNVGEKMRRGFLDWLAVLGVAARPSRLPVVLKLADAAQEPLLASAPVQLQAEADGSPVVFETEKDLRVVPGRLDVVVGVDADKDEFYLTPPGLSDLTPIEALPTQWLLKSFASAGATKLQLDPDAGLEPEMIIEAERQQYRITQVDNDIVTIDPALKSEMRESTIARTVTTFSPFDGIAINRQEHALYLGHMELLNIEAASTIEVVGATALRTGVTWQYWGKVEESDVDDWRPLTLAKADEQRDDAVVLRKKKGAVEPRDIGGKNSRWIRALLKRVEGMDRPLLQTDSLELRVNCKRGTIQCPPNSSLQEPSPSAEGMANTTPLVLDSVFSPLGREPRQFDAFYLGSQEAFSKKGAMVQLCFEMADSSFAVLGSLRPEPPANLVLAGIAADGQLHLLEFDEEMERLSRMREPVRPPSPGPSGIVVSGPAASLDRRPAYRPPVWGDEARVLTAVSAGSEVWVWEEDRVVPQHSGWESFGIVNQGIDLASSIHGLLYLEGGANGVLLALHDFKLFVRDLNEVKPTWRPIEVKNAGNRVTLRQIVPIWRQGEDRLAVGQLNEGIAAVDDQGNLYVVKLSGFPLGGACSKLLDDIDPDIAPAAVRLRDGKLIAVAVGKSESEINQGVPKVGKTPEEIVRTLRWFRAQAQQNLAKDAGGTIDLDRPIVIGNSIDVNVHGQFVTFITCLAADAQSMLQVVSFGADGQPIRQVIEIPPQVGLAGGAPTLLPGHIIVPTSSSEVISTSWSGPTSGGEPNVVK